MLIPSETAAPRQGGPATAAPVSVIVATIGRMSALRRCLDAVLAGATIPAEIIVIDQSGGPQVRELLASYSNSAVPFVHIPQVRRGLSAARNAGIAAAAQEIVAVTDDDCIPSDNWLSTIHATFSASPPPDAVTGRVLPFGAESPGTWAVSTRSSNIRREFQFFAPPWHVGTGGNVAVSREILQRIGGYHEGLGAGTPGRAGEDMDLFFRLLQSGATIRYEPEAIVYHERQDWARRVASRSGYGHGVGAFCGVVGRHSTVCAARLLIRWLVLRLRIILRRTLSREWIVLREECLVVKGTVEGFFYGIRLVRNASDAGR
jgi:O-antigen biosynthesis protein